MKVAVVLIAAFLLLAPLALSSNRGFALGQEDDVEDVILEDEEDGAYGDFGSEGEDEDEAYESDGLIGSNEDIVTFVTFPDNQNLEFPVGSIATAFVGVHNKGDTPFILSGVDGSIRHPLDYSQAFQNFTPSNFELGIEAGTEITVEYLFRPADRFEPRDFILNIDLHFHSEEEHVFINSVFNETVTLVDAETQFDLKQTFVYLVVVAAALFAFIYKRDKGTENTAAVKKAQAKADAELVQSLGTTDTTAVEDSFIADHIRKTGQVSKGKKKKGKK
eukprot:m.48133 g.48133  ORF g.48133 m.48133 type:complete len:276 (+) comp10814_c0_seq5:129-956(+)